MSNQENKDFIDLGSDPISDDFDPFASDDELDAEIPANTVTPTQQQEPASPPAPGNPLENAIITAETKETEKTQQGLFGKLPVFEYAGATEAIEDDSKTFDELRIEKAADFPELDDGKRVSWTVEYGKITKPVPNPKATPISKIKSEIETSKEFLDSLKKAKDKNPTCKIKPRVTAQSKGIASYKGIFRTLAEADASNKHIRILPARDGHVYEIRCTEAGKFIARTENIQELSEISAGFEPAFPPVPFNLFAQVLAFFRHYMSGGRETEVMVYIYWDKEEAKYVIRVPMQRVSKAHISVVIPPDETIDSDRYVHIADIHSHNSMPAFFSGTDDRDEQATRVYIVVGLLNQNAPEVAVRISVGGRFVPINLRQVVEIPSVSADSGGQYPYKTRQRFAFPDCHSFPKDWLSMVNIASGAAVYPTANPAIMTRVSSRMPWFGWLKGFHLRKGA